MLFCHSNIWFEVPTFCLYIIYLPQSYITILFSLPYPFKFIYHFSVKHAAHLIYVAAQNKQQFTTIIPKAKLPYRNETAAQLITYLEQTNNISMYLKHPKCFTSINRPHMHENSATPPQFMSPTFNLITQNSIKICGFNVWFTLAWVCYLHAAPTINWEFNYVSTNFRLGSGYWCNMQFKPIFAIITKEYA